MWWRTFRYTAGNSPNPMSCRISFKCRPWPLYFMATMTGKKGFHWLKFVECIKSNSFYAEKNLVYLRIFLYIWLMFLCILDGIWQCQIFYFLIYFSSSGFIFSLFTVVLYEWKAYKFIYVYTHKHTHVCICVCGIFFEYFLACPRTDLTNIYYDVKSFIQIFGKCVEPRNFHHPFIYNGVCVCACVRWNTF